MMTATIPCRLHISHCIARKQVSKVTHVDDCAKYAGDCADHRAYTPPDRLEDAFDLCVSVISRSSGDGEACGERTQETTAPIFATSHPARVYCCALVCAAEKEFVL